MKSGQGVRVVRCKLWEAQVPGTGQVGDGPVVGAQAGVRLADGLADGSFDSTFGSGGVVGPVPRESPQGLVVTPEGNIVVSKLRFTSTGNLKASGVNRYLG